MVDPITNEFYYGSRSCDCNPEDDPYMGSYAAWYPEDKSRLIKTILKSNFRKRSTAVVHEAKLIKKDIKHPLNRNYHIPNKDFGNYVKIKKYHKFKTNKIMKEWCKNNGVKCNTHNGSDVDWNHPHRIREVNYKCNLIIQNHNG